MMDEKVLILEEEDTEQEDMKKEWDFRTCVGICIIIIDCMCEIGSVAYLQVGTLGSLF